MSFKLELQLTGSCHRVSCWASLHFLDMHLSTSRTLIRGETSPVLIYLISHGGLTLSMWAQLSQIKFVTADNNALVTFHMLGILG